MSCASSLSFDEEIILCITLQDIQLYSNKKTCFGECTTDWMQPDLLLVAGLSTDKLNNINSNDNKVIVLTAITLPRLSCLIASPGCPLIRRLYSFAIFSNRSLSFSGKTCLNTSHNHNQYIQHIHVHTIKSTKHTLLHQVGNCAISKDFQLRTRVQEMTSPFLELIRYALYHDNLCNNKIFSNSISLN